MTTCDNADRYSAMIFGTVI